MRFGAIYGICCINIINFFLFLSLIFFSFSLVLLCLFYSIFFFFLARRGRARSPGCPLAYASAYSNRFVQSLCVVGSTAGSRQVIASSKMATRRRCLVVRRRALLSVFVVVACLHSGMLNFFHLRMEHASTCTAVDRLRKLIAPFTCMRQDFKTPKSPLLTTTLIFPAIVLTVNNAISLHCY